MSRMSKARLERRLARASTNPITETRQLAEQQLAETRSELTSLRVREREMKHQLASAIIEEPGFRARVEQIADSVAAALTEHNQFTFRRDGVQILVNNPKGALYTRSLLERVLFDGLGPSIEKLGESRRTLNNVSAREFREIACRALALMVVPSDEPDAGMSIDDAAPILSRELLATPAEGATPRGFRSAMSGLCDSWSDRDLMSLGLSLWDASYRLFPNDPSQAAESIEDTVSRLYAPASRAKRTSAVSLAQFAAAWANDAFQCVVTTHTYAAALMCSDADRDSIHDLHMPWRAFMVKVPDGLLRVDNVDWRRVLIYSTPAGAAIHIYAQENNCGAIMYAASNVATVLEDCPDGDPTWEALNQDHRRILRLARRLVIGLLMAMTYTDNFKRSPQRHGGTSQREPGAQPDHRVTFVGKPLTIDCRGKVRAYLDGKQRGGGKGRAPAVQVLVRGFFRRQVVGVGRTGRKVIWVEPFWRGAEGAPILTKPKKVGRGDTQET